MDKGEVDTEVVEGEEGAWGGRLCEEIGGERVDVPVLQKIPSEVATTAYEEGVLTWASGAERLELGALWGEGREQEIAGELRDVSRERGRGEGWDEVMGLEKEPENTNEVWGSGRS